ncbi:MAG: Lrp/AsnC family transcriptional regulator [Nanoarchaeota archaeon]|nr:Lrp/AsnC family transcriptional regulator [Nanoarchaeota archaeon]
MVELDKKDLQILGELQEDGSLSVGKLAKKTRIPTTTVHNRLKNLKKEGVIKKFTVQVDKKKLGIALFGYILINVDNDFLKKEKMTQESLARKIKMLPQVESASIIAGATDIVIRVAVNDVDELNDLIVSTLRNIDGVHSTTSLIVLKDIE